MAEISEFAKLFLPNTLNLAIRQTFLLQWNLKITDTLGPAKSAQIIKVS